MPGSPKTRLVRSNRANGPISSSSTAIRPRSTRKPLRGRKCSKPGLRARKCGSGRRLRLLSARNKLRRSQDLRQLLGLAARLVPDIVWHAGAAVCFEEARDRRVAIGPVAREDFDAALAEHLADLVAVDRRGFVDLARQAPVGSEVEKHRM